MDWWVWLIIGLVIGILALIMFVWVVDTIDSRQSARVRAVRQRQSDAEHKMQSVVQGTIQQMFEATRGFR